MKASAYVAYFNSIKVQLELSMPDAGEYYFFIFQFHKGTIRTYGFHTNVATKPNFNSIKVQLEQKRVLN